MNKCSFHKPLNYKAKAEHKHNSPVKIIKLRRRKTLIKNQVFGSIV